MADFKIISGAWAQLQAEAAPVREQVFIQEQQIAMPSRSILLF